MTICQIFLHAEKKFPPSMHQFLDATMVVGTYKGVIFESVKVKNVKNPQKP